MFSFKSKRLITKSRKLNALRGVLEVVIFPRVASLGTFLFVLLSK